MTAQDLSCARARALGDPDRRDVNAVRDGEVVCFDGERKPRFYETSVLTQLRPVDLAQLDAKERLQHAELLAQSEKFERVLNNGLNLAKLLMIGAFLDSPGFEWRDRRGAREPAADRLHLPGPMAISAIQRKKAAMAR